MGKEQQKELRILFLEDSPLDAEVAEHVLRKDGLVFTSRRVDTRDAFIRALEEFKPDVILSDYKLPEFDGLTALKIVRQTHPEVPVIMVTGAFPDIEAVELLHEGAKDYVLKDRLARLAPAVQRVLSAERGICARKAAEKAVHESEEKFRQICATAQDAILMMDSAGRITFWNNAAEKIFGYAAEETLGKELHTLIVPERFRETFHKNIPAFVATGSGAIIGKTLELAAFGKNREEFPVELSVSAAKLGSQWNAIGFIRNISERKRAEQTILHANRAFKTLSACNHELVHATDEAQLLQAMCRVIVEASGYRAAWVGYAQHDAGKTVRPMAQYGFEAGDLDALQITWADSERGQGVTGKAVRSGMPQIVQDIASNPGCAPWHEQALKYGHASSIALPLHSGADVFGSLTIYAAEANAFDQGEVTLLQGMADDLVFGIRMLRLRQEQQHSAERERMGLEGTVQAIAAMVEMRDPYTAGHQWRVAQLAAAIALEMGLPKNQVRGIHLAGTIHDLGKIQIPAEILSKPGKLSANEFSLIKEHPQNGYEILKNIQFPWPIAQIVLQHHEKLDGSGYPLGLKGNEILLDARILTVADVVEAMSSHRPYRPGLGLHIALEEIGKGRGLRYDPDVVDTCIRLFKEKNFVLEKA